MPNFRERLAAVLASASSAGVALRVTGDTQDRVVLDAGGRISWGSGSAAADATLERSSTSVVRITNGLVVDTAGGGAPSRTVVLKNSGQNSVAFGAFPWEWSTSLQLQSNDSSRWLWLNAGSNDGSYNSRIRAGNTGLDIYVGGTSANNGTLGLTVASAGSVGIGTASPAAKLQVVGNARIGQASNSSTSALLEITAGGSGYDSIIDLGYWDTFDAALWFLKRHGADGSFRIANVGTGSEVPVLTITNSNTVGVGTTAPGSNKMRVEGGYLSVNNAELGTGELRIGAVYSLPGIYADVASLALRINSGTSSTGIELATNGNNVRLSINNSGVVSIPGSLSVTGGVTANLTGNATTATTLQTARTIGDVSFNGSANIVPERIFYKDTRAVDYNPYTYTGVSLHLKTNATDGLTDGGTYHGVLDLVRWSDSSGGKDFQIAVTDNGNVYTRTNNTNTTWNAWRKLWSDGNDGAGSGLDADLLDGNQGSYYASTQLLESVLGDLLNVGTYDAAANAPSTKPVPSWSGGSTVYRHGMYWVVSSLGDVDFLTVDVSQRENQNLDGTTTVYQGDWIVATNPSHNPANPNVNLTVGQVTWKWISFSAENYVNRQIAEHARDASDPHSAAGYLTRIKADPIYSQIGHNHDVDIANAITAHRTPPTFTITNKALTGNVATLTTSAAHVLQVGMGVRVTGVDSTFNGVYPVSAVTSTTFSYAKTAANVTSTASGGQALISPHYEYLHAEEAANLYAPIGHNHDGRYEPIGTVVAHEGKSDPHPQYLTQGEGDARYTVIGHNHNDLYYTKTQVDSAISAIPPEVYATDGAQSRRIFVGDQAPSSPQAGDIWIETLNVALQAPAAPSNLAIASPNGTTVNLSWAAWPTGAAQSRVRVQRRNGADWTTIAPDTPFDDQSAPFATSFTDTGRLENTEYFYRVWANNTAGDGAYGYISITTANDAPGPPTGLSTSGITATSVTLSWSAPSPFADPGASGARYEVFLNGISVGFAPTTTTSYTYTGLTERTSYTLGVRARDSAGLTSTIATTTATTGNAAPPAPKSAASSGVTHNQATLTWAAGDPVPAQGHPAGGITDFLRYRVYRNDVEIATTTNTSYTFTGLSASTAYKLEARAEDSLNVLSADDTAGSFVNITTLVNPDTTPPAAPTITYFKPVTSYGRMEVNGTWPSDADTNYGEIAYYPGNGDPVLLWQGAVTPGASFTRNFHTNGGVTEVAGQTPVVNVRARDSNGNWSTTASSTYTLITSPYLLSADSSNSWRNEAGGRYNSAGNFRLYQGYFSNPALNSIGLWYYGTKIADQVHNGGRRTFTNVEIFMRRNTGGDGVPRDVSIVLHNETTNPGNAYTTGPTTYNTPTVVATLAWNGGEAWAVVPSGWWTDLINGTRKGVAIRDTDGIPYVVLDSVSENGDSGKLRFTHLG